MKTLGRFGFNNRTKSFVGLAAACGMMAGAVNLALAAELTTAELDGVTNYVTVEQGDSANFTISLSATGSVACDSSHTAAVHTAYSVNGLGAVSSSTPSAAKQFSASSTCNGNNAPITWTNAPAPQTVSASVSAAAGAPVGEHTITLNAQNGNVIITDSNEQHGKLEDKEGTTLKIKVVAPTAPANSAPSVSFVNPATSANEGDSKTFAFSVSDSNSGDTFSVASGYPSCGVGGSLVAGSLSLTASGGSFDCRFPDGPASPTVSMQVKDAANAVSNIAAAAVGVANVAPTVTLSGLASADEGDRNIYSYTVRDPGDDAATTTITEDCGAATLSDTLTGFDCTFPDNGSYTVSVSADDGDSVNNVGSDSKTVTVSNVAPSIINWSLTGANGTACIGGNTVSLSFEVDDPADEANDPITGTAFQPFMGRTVSQMMSFGAGPWSRLVTANDDDGGTATRLASGTFLYSTANGFPLAPINTDGTSNFKLGSTIPVKLRVLDCNNQPVADLAPLVNLVRTSTSTDGTVNEEVITTSVPDEGKTMRYDTAGLQYIYNLSTKRSVFAADGGALSTGRYKLSISGTGLAPLSVGFDILK